MPEIKIDVPWSVVDTLLASAFCGGSSYWCQCVGHKYPHKSADKQNVQYRYQSALYPGGCFLVEVQADYGDTNNGKRYEIDQMSLMAGLQVMAEQYPRHFAAAISRNGDSITGDVYLQCCCFRKVVYG